MTTFGVWAPSAEQVDLVLDCRDVKMRSVNGWWSTEIPDVAAGTRYGFRLNGTSAVLPDPRSAQQPDGVHGRSAVVDHREFPWTDEGWHGRPLPGAVLYECHVGTFTSAGTFDGVISRLPHLASLGVDALELMPVAATAGRRNWGYDGVALFAVSEHYGGPEGLKRLVDAAHGHGLAVVLDVVYNHLGAAGNYLPEFGPYLGEDTAWGQSVNLDGPGSDPVRRFILDNALSWLRDYHLDGLRLDAVHALRDTRALHIIEELTAEVESLAQLLGRALWLTAESDQNDPRLVRARDAGGYGLNAVWCDDVHHALHAALTGERRGYYADFGPLPVLAKALTQVFVHDGSWSSFRGRSHGRPVGTVTGDRFIVALQNHDQVGNRAKGDRLPALCSDGLLRVGAALHLCSPYTPLLFMGEEWAATTPWQFFSDPDSEQLRREVRRGRHAEFADHGWPPDQPVPDPLDPATFQRSQLDWDELDHEPHQSMLAWYRELLALRRSEPDLLDGRRERTWCQADDGKGWLAMYRGNVVVVANLRASRRSIPIEGSPIAVLAASSPNVVFSNCAIELDGESVVVLRRQSHDKELDAERRSEFLSRSAGPAA